MRSPDRSGSPRDQERLGDDVVGRRLADAADRVAPDRGVVLGEEPDIVSVTCRSTVRPRLKWFEGWAGDTFGLPSCR